MIGVIYMTMKFNVFICILIQGSLGIQPSAKGVRVIETHTTYACSFANAAIYNSCPDLNLACPARTVIHISNARYVKEYALHEYCTADATMYSYCNSMCCLSNGNTLNHSVSNLPQDSLHKLYKYCNNKNQCSLTAEFPTKITDHYEYVSVSFNCTDDARFYVPRATSTSPLTTTVTVTASLQFSETNKWLSTAISESFTTSAWLSLKHTRLSNQTQKQTFEASRMSVMAFVVPAVIIVVSVGIGVFLFWRKRRKENERNMAVDSNYDILQRTPTTANNIYESISYVVENQPEPNVTKGSH